MATLGLLEDAAPVFEPADDLSMADAPLAIPPLDASIALPIAPRSAASLDANGDDSQRHSSPNELSS
jgi:hypothetical protein